MQNTSFVDALISTAAAHAELAALQDVVAEMGGNHLPPIAIGFVEQRVSAALQRAEAADAAFPRMLDDALVDWQRATRLSSETAVY